MYDRGQYPVGQTNDWPEKRSGHRLGMHLSSCSTRHGIPKKGPIGPELAKTLLHGYYACVSHYDAQIGMMLGALEEAGIRDDTVIVV